MLNDKEKLIDSLESIGIYEVTMNAEPIAEALLANGVTVRDDAEWKRFAQQNLKLLGAKVYGHDKIFEHNVSARTCHTQTREKAFIDGYLYCLDCVAAMISSCPQLR